MAIIAYFLVFNHLQSSFLFLHSIFINTFQPYSIIHTSTTFTYRSHHFVSA